MRSTRLLTAALALAVLSACGGGKQDKIDGPQLARGFADGIPQILDPDFAGISSATELGSERLAPVAEAAPEGLHITTIQISPLSLKARNALKYTGFRSGNGPGLLTLPIYGINPELGMYYLVVPVVNEGPAIVRNLKARADFLDANGIIVWSETEPLTYFPTRLGLNPPSLPNSTSVPAGELGQSIRGFSTYFFAGNVGIFTFAVPDVAVAKTVKSWTLSFLVSTT